MESSLITVSVSRTTKKSHFFLRRIIGLLSPRAELPYFLNCTLLLGGGGGGGGGKPPCTITHWHTGQETQCFYKNKRDGLATVREGRRTSNI